MRLQNFTPSFVYEENPENDLRLSMTQWPCTVDQRSHEFTANGMKGQSGGGSGGLAGFQWGETEKAPSGRKNFCSLIFLATQNGRLIDILLNVNINRKKNSSKVHLDGIDFPQTKKRKKKSSWSIMEGSVPKAGFNSSEVKKVFFMISFSVTTTFFSLLQTIEQI